MALSRPVIATPVGALPDLLPPEALVDVGDVDGLSSKLASLLADPVEWEMRGAEARDRVEGCCTWPLVASATARVYSDVIESRS